MKVIIDRIEGGFAVVELENGSHFNLPTGLLPEGAKEGSVIDISLDKAAEEKSAGISPGLKISCLSKR